MVFPARAGMIPEAVDAGYVSEGIPRESGDDPPPSFQILRRYLYSPRERG